MNYFQKKKLFLMSIVNKVKGFVRTVSGVPPLTLESCVDDKSVINYQIYGNSVQDGTPSPENPIEVVSVGEKTKNLFNPVVVFYNSSVMEKIINDDGSFNLSGTPRADYYFNYNINDVVSLSSGEHFTVSVTYDYEGDKNPNLGVVFRNGRTIVAQAYCTNGNSRSVTLSDDVDNIGFRISNLTAGEYYEIKNIRLQIEEGSISTEYEPYGKYKIPVTAGGKNLFDKNMTLNKGYLTNVGEVVEAGGWLHTDYIRVYGDTVTISGLSGSNPSICAYDENKNFITGVNYEVSRTLTASGMKYIRASLGGGNTKNSVQIEYGDTATEYEPYKEPITTNIYLNEPLRAVGDYKDYIDFETKKLVRNIYMQPFERNKNTGRYKTQITEVLRISNHVPSPTFKKQASLAIMSSLFEAKDVPSKYHYKGENIFRHDSSNHYYFSLYWERLGLIYDGTNVCRIDDNTQTALTDAEIIDIVCEYMFSFPKEYLNMYMVLATPTEEDIELPDIATFKGMSVTYTVDTTVQPTEMSVTYYSNTKGE